ncbi:MAG TPA: hypothetical protein VMW72_23330 [Sedimentisphaerales bacterium]|nr:hypothetical protein [Sedimentisphaerales bacterium]
MMNQCFYRTRPGVLTLMLSSIVSVVILAAVGGCGSSRIPTSIGMYGDSPPSDAIHSRVFEATFDEAFEASSEAVVHIGMFVESTEEDKGKITGNGRYQMMCGGGPCLMTATFAIYINEVSDKPETRITFVATRHGFTGIGGGTREMSIKFMIQVQKVLLTYQ